MSFPFKIPFAASGDQSIVPDSDLTGSVNFTDGYTPDYQADPSSDPNAKLIERDKFNFLMNKTTGAIGEIQRQGTADWYADLAPYDLNAEVFHNGKRWRSTIANNSATPDTGSEWLDVTPGTAAAKNVATEATAATVPARDANGTFKVGAPTDPTHPVRLGDIKLSSNITVTVGTGADFETINEALTHLSNFYPEYKNTGVTATIELQAGFVMAEQVLVRGIDLGWITITGVDAETAIDRSALTIDFTTADYGAEHYPAFGVSKGGALPRVGQLFNMNSNGDSEQRHGVMAVGAGSSADVLPACGVKNAGYHGIIADNGSTINALGADASGAGNHGIVAYGVSTVNAQDADASGAGVNGVQADGGSTINARGADASGAGTHGIVAYEGGTVNARSVNAQKGGSPSSSDIMTDGGSSVIAFGATGGTSQTVNTLTRDGIIFK